MGAATGHVGVQVVLRNVSAVPCHLYGFPGLQLLNASGVALPTVTHWGGSFLFPALSPHMVGLAPAQKASFDLAYVDIPIGNPAPSYQQACPATATLAIIPPDDFTSLSTTAKISPCNGGLSVSAVVPGTTRIPFDGSRPAWARSRRFVIAQQYFAMVGPSASKEGAVTKGPTLPLLIRPAA